MRKRGFWRYTYPLLVAGLLTIGSAGTVLAQVSSSSDNYQATETQFSSGSALESCSDEYCARASIGDGGAGSSNTITANFGAVTPDEPLLEVVVTPGESNLGVLTTEQTATKETTVQIRNYLSEGYTLQVIGDPPKYGDHALATSDTPEASDPGTEQFGINVVANTTPTVGKNPVQVPSGEFSFGAATEDYATPNRFMYASGDVIARSTMSSGRTDYTISMVINISNRTPAGHFSGDFAAVVIPLY